MNFRKLTLEVMKDRDTCIEWLLNHGLLTRTKNCRKCGGPMKLEVGINGWGRLRCRKHNECVQITKRSFFESVRLAPEKSIILMYCWAHQFSYEKAIHESSFDEERTSSSKVSDWYSYCREVAMFSLDRKFEEKLGGEGHVIEIDEMKLGKRKYHKGRYDHQVLTV